MAVFTIITDSNGNGIGSHSYAEALPTVLPPNETPCTALQASQAVLWKVVGGVLTPNNMGSVTLNSISLPIGKQIRDAIQLVILSNLLPANIAPVAPSATVTPTVVGAFNLPNWITGEIANFISGSVTIPQLLTALQACIAEIGLQ